MSHSRNPLEPDFMYHIFNRAIGKERLFIKEDNYKYFLEKYQKYIQPVANTYVYCLMPNHLHLLVKIKNEHSLKAIIKSNQKSKEIDLFISQQFGNLFNAYTKAFNKVYDRRGSLFMKPFKRKQVKDETYLRKVVHYIHFNPVKANLVANTDEWKYSFYNAVISQNETKIKKKEVVRWFDNLENFKYCHLFPPQETGIDLFF